MSERTWYEYAMIDENGLIIGGVGGQCEQNQEGYILLDEGVRISDIMRKKRWNGTEWEDYEYPPIPLSEDEQMKLESALNLEYLVCMKKLGL